MPSELNSNPEQLQQKFEGIVERNEGAILNYVDLDESYAKSLGNLQARIDKNSYLEADEKQKLKTAALREVAADLDGLDSRLEGLARREADNTVSARYLLYQRSIEMVNDINQFLGRQIDRASDYGVIMDDEFSPEVLKQIPYLRSGLPRLDALAKEEMEKGAAPRAAMQLAVDRFLKIPGKLTIFTLDLLYKRYPDLHLPDQSFDCVRIQGAENLRDINTGRVVRSAAVGEKFQIMSSLPAVGKYQYASVLDARGNTYKLCLNDGNHVGMMQFWRGKFEPTYSPDQSGEALVEIENLAEPLKTMVTNGFATPEGILTDKVNPYQIGQVIPASAQEGFITFHHSLNGANIPKDQPIPITKQGGNFVFGEPYTGLGRTDGRVRIYAGDKIAFRPAAPTERKEVAPRSQEMPATVAAYWQWTRGNWEAPNVIDMDKQEKPVCAGYVQRTLEGMYGHDFAKDVFSNGDRAVDAWMMASRIEASGYGHVAMDFSRYFDIDRSKGSIGLKDDAPGYNNDLQRLLRLASSTESETGVLFMHYKHTRANPNIFANLDSGGSLNSHAVLILGSRSRSFSSEVKNSSLATTIIDSLKARLGTSYDDSWEQNRYLLGSLRGVKVNGREVRFQDGEFYDEQGAVVGVNVGDQISYQDTQVTDFYHNPSDSRASPARVVGLTELMIQGNFEPVKLAQWNKEYVSTRPTESKNDFIVGEFKTDGSTSDLRAALAQHYVEQVGRDPEFGIRNPSQEIFVKRSMDFLLYVHVIQSPDGLPIPGTRIPIFDWSKYPQKPKKTPEPQPDPYSLEALQEYAKKKLS